MRRIYLVLLTGILFAGMANAQVAVTVTGNTNTTPNLAASYTSLALAITDLNLITAISGPVVLTCAAAGTETAPVSGYAISFTATTSSTNNIVIDGASSTITAGLQAAGSNIDAVFKIIGSDYVTITNFVMQENAGNTVTATGATNTMTEWGVALLRVSATDGAQNNTILNNTISLNKAYPNSWGIYSNVRHAAGTPTTSADITAATGANNSNKVYGNGISNVNYGIVFVGSGGAGFFDVGNDIGGSSFVTGNLLTNWGSNTVNSGFISVSGTMWGIFVNQQTGVNVSYNTLTSATGIVATTFRGIFNDFSVAAPTGTFTNSITNNTITLNSANTTGTFEAIRSQGMTALSTATININNNTILNGVISGAASSSAMVCIVNSSAPGVLSMSNNIIQGNTSTATTGGFTGVSNTGAVVTTINLNSNQIGNSTAGPVTFSAANSATFTGITNSGGAATATLSINSNNFQGITYSTASTGANTYISNTTFTGASNVNSNTFTNLNVNITGSVTFITNSVTHAASTSHTANSNSIVTAFNKGGAGGTVQFFLSNSTSPSTVTETSTLNNFSNITVTGATTIAGWQNTDGGSPVTNVTSNTFNNITGGTNAITVLNVGFSSNGTVTGNIITNVTSGGSITGLSSSSGTQTISGNTINNLSSTGASSTVIGLSVSGGTTQTISGNTINTISGSGATAPVANGISISGGTTVNVSKNKIYDILESNAVGIVNGILISGGTTVTASNNLIGDLRATAATGLNAINGINITGSTTSNIYFNTIHLNATSTSVTTFGTSCITFATTPTLNLRNNILVNVSTPAQNGANVAANGIAAALRRASGTAATVPANYATTSNNNLFWANPTAGTNNHETYAEGTATITNSMNTLALMKAFMVNRDQASVTEDLTAAPTFLSTTGSSSNFLHISTSVATQVESGAATIATFTDDYDGDIRNVSTPDIGADEGTFILSDVTGPSISYTALTNTLCLTAPSLVATITDASLVNTTAGTKPRLWYRKGSNANSLPGTNDNTTDGWKYVEASNASSPFSFPIDYSLLFGGTPVAGDIIHYFVVSQDLAGTPNLSINTGTFTTAPPTVALNAGAFPVSLNNTYSLLSGIPTSGVTVGTAGTYASLSATGGLFAAINAAGLTGNTVVTVTTNTAETGAVALNQIAYGCGGPFTLTISPAATITPTLSGPNATALLDLNGADNVIFDGSNSGGTSKDMTISNTDLGGAAIRFINDATTNTVKNCIVQGVSASSSNGTITFSTSTGTSGNSSNIINNCDIRDGATVPINAVYSSGTGGALNSSNTISGCRIFNFSGTGVLVTSTGAGNGWTINPTSFYQTATRTVSVTVISIQGGSGHTISGNSIGGAASDRSGTPFTVTGSSATFTGISLGVGTASTTNVQGNTLSNLNISGSSSQTFKGIVVTSGNVNIGTTTANTIGGLAAAYDTVRVNYDADMIENSGGGIVNIENNLITNVSYYNAGGDRLFGIRGTAGTVSIKNNIIHDFKSNATSTTFSFFPGGIWLATTVAGANVEGNQVYNIAQTNPGTSAYTIAGIYVSGVSSTGTPTTIKKNKVYGITAVGTGTGSSAPRVWGIHVAGGSATYTNNMVSVGAGSGLETRLNGIEDLGSGTNNYYFNSVYTSGTTSAGSNNSYAFNRSGTTTVELRNNLFGNSRIGGSGFHVGIANTNASATGWSATASNYNDLYSSTSGTTAQWLGTAVGNNRDLTGWKAAQSGGSGGDANSVSILPGFISVTNLHIDPNNGYLHDNLGIPFGSIGDDIDGNSRSGSTPDLGADEFTGIAPTIDVSAQAITGIPASACPNSSVPISVTVKNETGATLDFSANNMTITLNITGASTQTLTATLTTGTLGAGVSQSYLLSPNADLSANGTHNFAASITLTGETNTANNTANASKAINGTTSATLPQRVDFTGYTGANLTALFPNWSEATGTTTPSGTTSGWTNRSTWSPADTTIKVNLFTNTANEWIVGPKFLATATTELHFDAAITDFAAVTPDPSGMQGTDDRVVVKISTDCGATYSDLYTFNAANTTTLTNVQTAQSINLSAYAGQTIIIAFYATDGPVDDSPDYDFHIDDINIINTIPIDAGATALALPAAAGCYGATETVSVTVKNYGSATLDFSVTPLTVNTNVTGAVVASLSGTISTGTLAPNATVNVPMSTTLNMTTAGTYTFNASTTIAGDGNAGNDAMAPVNRTPSTLAGGTYTVGSGGNYATITAAVAAYNSATCITGAIVFNLIDNNYPSETFPITINANGAASSTNTLTIKTTLANTTISGSSASAIIILNGADYVTIDGSTGSTANTVCPVVTATRDLTITNTNTGTSSAIVWLQTAGSDGATNNTIKNCNLTGNSNTTTLVAAGTGGTTIASGTGANGNNNNSIVNNNISKVQIGIFTAGSAAGTMNQSNIINQNLLNTASPNNVGRVGIMALFENGITISGNHISGIISAAAADIFGIAVGVNGISTTTLGGGEATNATITNNVIGTVQQTNTFSAAGIAVQATTTGTTLIANNMLSGVNANGTLGDFATGIILGGGTGSTTNVYYNSVTMAGTFTGGSYPSYALAVHGSTDPVVDLRNNIFTSTGSTGADLNRAMGFAGTAFTNLTSNNNDLFASGTGSGVVQTGTLSNTGGTVYTTVTGGGSWNAASSKDANSKNVAPVFVSATDLHLLSPDASNLANLESTGATVSVTTDIDCASRPSGGLATAPDIGADEFAGATPPCGNVTGLVASSITLTSANLNWDVTPGATGYEYAVITSATPPGSGTATTNNFVTPAGGLSSSTVYYAHVRSNCGGGNFGNWATISFTTLCAPFSIPYSQNFDGVTSPALPVCITTEDKNGFTTWVNSTGLPRSASNNMVYSYDPVAPADDWFFTAPLALTGGTSYRLTFWTRARGFTEKLEVKFGTPDTATVISSGTVLIDTSFSTSTYFEVTRDFIPGSTGTYFIGFHAKSDPDEFELHVDDILVDLTPTCPPPTSVNVIATGATSASVSFSPAAGTNYEVEYGPVGFTHGTGTIVAGTGSPVVVTGIAITDTTLDVYVRQVCGGTPGPWTTTAVKFLRNDDAAGALLLTVGAGCAGAVYTNLNSTASTNEDSVSCSGKRESPIWFKFKAPASGAVRISTDIGAAVVGFYDTKLALFSVTDSTDYNTINIISCDEDGGSNTAIGGFGYASVVYAVGLVPNQVYLVAVDKFATGFSGTSGNFCIAVDELNSSMLASTTSPTCTFNESPGGSNNYTGWVPLVESTDDAGSKLIALVRNTNGLGAPVSDYDSIYLYLHSGAVRQDAVSKEYYLNRNFHIGNSVVGTSNIEVKLFFTDAELAALKAVDPAANLSNLRVTRQAGICATDFAGVGNAELPQTDSGSVGGAKWIGFTTPGFSNFYLHSTRAPIITKVFLQGAFDSTIGRHKDVATSWRDILNNNALVQPYDSAAFGNYNGGETVAGGFFTSDNAHARDPLDWVLLEVKDVTLSKVIRRAALVREDGKIVDINGDTLVTLNGLATGNYYITIRHRNHLGISTQNLLPITSKALGVPPPTSAYDFDFSTASYASIYGDSLAFRQELGVNVMIGGNSNHTGSGLTRVSYGGSQNDPGAVLLYLGSSPLGNVFPRYSKSDVNFDGRVRYGGSQNDPGFILSRVLKGSPLGIILEQKR